MHRYRLAVPILTLTLLLSACAMVAPSGREAMRQYQLSLLDVETVAEAPRTDALLLVERPQPAPGFDTNRMAYQTQAHELRYYTRSRWTDTPARMLQPALVDAMEQSTLFKAVVSPPTTVAADYRLVTDMLRLQQQFDGNGDSRARLRLRVQLIDVDGQEVLASRMIDVSRPAPSANAEGGVIAANEALREAAHQIKQFTAAALPADGSAYARAH